MRGSRHKLLDRLRAHEPVMAKQVFSGREYDLTDVAIVVLLHPGYERIHDLWHPGPGGSLERRYLLGTEVHLAATQLALALALGEDYTVPRQTQGVVPA